MIESFTVVSWQCVQGLLACELHLYRQGWQPWREERWVTEHLPEMLAWAAHTGDAIRGYRCFLCILVIGGICIMDTFKNGLEANVLPLYTVKRFCLYPSSPPACTRGYFSGRWGKEVMQDSVPGGTAGIKIWGGEGRSIIGAETLQGETGGVHKKEGGIKGKGLLVTGLMLVLPWHHSCLAVRICWVAYGWATRDFPACEGQQQDPAGRVGSIFNHTGPWGVSGTRLPQPRTRTTDGGRKWESYWGLGNPSSSAEASRMATLIPYVGGLGLNINWFMSMSSSGHWAPQSRWQSALGTETIW